MAASETSEGPLVDVRGLAIAFETARGARVEAVRGIDLRIAPGECVALVGESGSGKSVTARALLGLAGAGAQVRAAQFRVDGRDALGFSARDWRGLRGTFAGLVMQDALVSLDPLRTIGDEVAETLSAHRLLAGRAALRQRALEALAQAGIDDPQARADQYAHQLSGGLRQRALIASAIAAGPRLLIADEPTTALDVTVQAQVLGLLQERVRQGTALLLISHDLAVVARIADRIIVMQHGEVVDAGSADEVLRRPRHAYTRQLLAAVPSAASRGHSLASARALPGEGGALRIERTPLPPLRQAPAGDPLLEVDGVGKRYRSRGSDFTALADVSFAVRPGEAVGIVGESGSGKTTCAGIVLGLIEPDSGRVRLQGQPWSGITEPLRRPLRGVMQYIPQDPLSSFDPRYSVQRIVDENLPARWKDATERRDHIAGLLRRVGLSPDLLGRHPRALSGGQRQRVAIARALAPGPRLIVCDEPVSALDVYVQAQVLDLLAELRAELGTALLFISHDLGVVQHVSDRVLVFHQGRIVEQGEVTQVFAAPSHPYTRTLVGAVATLPARAPLAQAA
ncbi:MAG: ABC transporter ATP-binding protein [Comamonas sp.]